SLLGMAEVKVFIVDLRKYSQRHLVESRLNRATRGERKRRERGERGQADQDRPMATGREKPMRSWSKGCEAQPPE
ncbi:hypothetical protein ACQP3L_34920, partial [Escherichia coli]